MIIIDEEEEHQVKFDSFVAGLTIRYPDKTVGRSSSPLPDYEASEAEHRLIIRSLQKPPTKRKLDSRILRATFYALAIYVALSAIIAVPVILLKHRNAERTEWSQVQNAAALWIDDTSIVSPPPGLSNAEVIPLHPVPNCELWRSSLLNSSQYTVTLQTTLSTRGSLAIRSNVSNDLYESQGIQGSLNVDVNSDRSANDVVIKVKAYASNHSLLQQTNVCVCGQGTESGLSIYAPANLTESQYIAFNIHLLFPQKKSPYTVSEFTTYLPMFTQHFASLSNHVTFDKISIFGNSYDVVCQSLRAPVVGVRNMRGGIIGNFNVSESLILDTINGPITTNITLVQGPSVRSPTVVALDTGNSHIDATISLSASPSRLIQGPPPLFIGRIKTFDGPINISITNDAPSNLPLKLYVENNDAWTNVTLDPLYQGTFNVRTKLAPAAVVDHRQKTPERPPSSIHYDQQQYGKASGWIGYGNRPTRRTSTDGQVEVVSALGSIALNLGPGVS
ncbi:hypothetical protein AX17_001450 [Amanita inopinata Kibby_2008]|nr:hypothetical protein AX17_001450 [Amanita inopinata Kibby_2008]